MKEKTKEQLELELLELKLAILKEELRVSKASSVPKTRKLQPIKTRRGLEIPPGMSGEQLKRYLNVISKND